MESNTLLIPNYSGAYAGENGSALLEEEVECKPVAALLKPLNKQDRGTKNVVLLQIKRSLQNRVEYNWRKLHLVTKDYESCLLLLLA